MLAISHRAFEPGTTGWTADDLFDSNVQEQWTKGRYELVDGVLTKMAPQSFRGVRPLSALRRLLTQHFAAVGLIGEFYHEVDLQLKSKRVPRPDMIFLTVDQHSMQEQIERDRGIDDGYCPVFVKPLLVIESVSKNHEAHDRETKLEWYAQAGIPHYWLLTAHEKSLICLAWKEAAYVEDSSGRDDEAIRIHAFGGMTISLAELWRKPH